MSGCRIWRHLSPVARKRPRAFFLCFGLPLHAPPARRPDPHDRYVWFDALTNYGSAVDFLGLEGSDLSRFWPADLHVIGKDITRFHCIYWPSMLMSADLPLPKCVFAHGFVNGPDGQKMSKSLGNVVLPGDLLDKYPTDAFR